MNPSTLQDTVVQMLQQSMASISSMADWTKGQLPELVHQFIVYRSIYHATFTILFCMIDIALVYISHKCYKRYKLFDTINRDTDTAQWNLLVCIFGYAFAFLFIFGIIHNAYELVLLHYAPKIYLINYVTDIMQSHH